MRHLNLFFSENMTTADLALINQLGRTGGDTGIRIIRVVVEVAIRNGDVEAEERIDTTHFSPAYCGYAEAGIVLAQRQS